MSLGKMRPYTHILGEKGVEILKSKFPVEWVVREYHPDYGIDLSVELFESGPYAITQGAHLFFQVKAAAHIEKSRIRIKNRSNVEMPQRPVSPEKLYMDVIKYQVDTDFLNTVERMGSAVPVIFAVVDVTSQQVFFLCLSDYIEKILSHEKDYRKQKTKTIYIPAENLLNDYGLRVIEWYAKRPRYYALFNKIHYQDTELRYVSQYELPEYIDHFIKILRRFDIWNTPSFIPYWEETTHEIDYYLEHGITEYAEQVVINMAQNGSDVDSEMWDADYCDYNHPVSFREAQKVQGLHLLWRKLSNLGNIFEEDCKEYFLPTAYYCLLTTIKEQLQSTKLGSQPAEDV